MKPPLNAGIDSITIKASKTYWIVRPWVVAVRGSVHILDFVGQRVLEHRIPYWRCDLVIGVIECRYVKLPFLIWVGQLADSLRIEIYHAV